MIVLHARVPVDPDHRDEALELVEELVSQSNREAGMIDYRAAIDIEDENTIRVFEQYEDEEAYETHTQSDHYEAFQDEIAELLAGEPTVKKFEVSDATERTV